MGIKNTLQLLKVSWAAGSGSMLVGAVNEVLNDPNPSMPMVATCIIVGAVLYAGAITFAIIEKDPPDRDQSG